MVRYRVVVGGLVDDLFDSLLLQGAAHSDRCMRTIIWIHAKLILVRLSSWFDRNPDTSNNHLSNEIPLVVWCFEPHFNHA
jgi:hypothetical protein